MKDIKEKQEKDIEKNKTKVEKLVVFKFLASL